MGNNEKNQLTGFVIDTSKLKDGDIILTANDTISSCLIRLITKSNFSHAKIIFNNPIYIHALPKRGVIAQNIQRKVFKKKEHVCVLRLKEYEKYSAGIEKIKSLIQEELSKGYNFFNAISTQIKLCSKEGLKSRKICSQLIAEIYSYVNINLTKNPNTCTPQDIYQSELLEFIDVPLIKLENMPFIYREDIKRDDLSIYFNDRDKRIIKSVKKYLPDENINTLKDIFNYLVEKHEFIDTEITNIFISESYFNDWKKIKEQHSYRYGEFNEFIKYIERNTNKDERIEIINQLSELSKREIERHTEHLDLAIKNNELLPRQFYKEEIELYKQLKHIFEILQEHCKKSKEHFDFKE